MIFLSLWQATYAARFLSGTKITSLFVSEFTTCTPLADVQQIPLFALISAVEFE
jgi:hypothetical protein